MSETGVEISDSSRASSRRHFITLLEVAQRETSETLDWLDVIVGPTCCTPRASQDSVRNATNCCVS
jgi:hypothetical protein